MLCSAYHTSVEIRALFYVTMLQITEHSSFQPALNFMFYSVITDEPYNSAIEA